MNEVDFNINETCPFCCQIVHYSQPIGFLGEQNIFALSQALLLLFGMIILFIRLHLLFRRQANRSSTFYTPERLDLSQLRDRMHMRAEENRFLSPILPGHLVFVQVACMMLLVEALVILPEPTPTVRFLQHLVFATLVKSADTYVTMMLLFPSFTHRTVLYSLGMTALIAGIYVSITFGVPQGNCNYCGPHLPNAYMQIPYSVTGVVYLTIAFYTYFVHKRAGTFSTSTERTPLLSSVNATSSPTNRPSTSAHKSPTAAMTRKFTGSRPVKSGCFGFVPRPAATLWCTFLGLCYLSASIPLTLLKIDQIYFDRAFCFLMVPYIVYVFVYALVLYKTLRNDTKFCSKFEYERRLAEDTRRRAVTRLTSSVDDVSVRVINANELHVIARLARGGFATVSRAIWTLPDGAGRDVALKEILSSNSKENWTAAHRSFLDEISSLAPLDHERIARLLGVVLDNNVECLVVEYVEGGSLFDALHSMEVECRESAVRRAIDRNGWKQRIRLAKDIVEGVAYLHAKKILHRDLKSPNVLLQAPDTVGVVRAKLCDFGLSRLLPEKTTQLTLIGTCHWLAPEVMLEKPSGAKADIYACGVLFHELATDRIPWEGTGVAQIVLGVAHQRKSVLDVVPPNDASQLLFLQSVDNSKEVPRVLFTTMCACLEWEAKKRPSANEVVSMFDDTFDAVETSNESIEEREEREESKEVEEDIERFL